MHGVQINKVRNKIEENGLQLICEKLSSLLTATDMRERSENQSTIFPEVKFWCS